MQIRKLRRVKELVNYLKDSYHELVYKVTWPTWDELQNNTVIVVLGSVIFALIIFVMDFIFGVNPSNADSSKFFWEGVLGYIYP